MIAFLIAGEYTDGGVTEFCWDPDNARFLRRHRRWATDPWTTTDQFCVPDEACGISLLNALAHAHPRQALEVAKYVRDHGPVLA
jgi:hypothetical protein